MSLYRTSAIMNKLYDPLYFSQSRCEFRLDQELYKPNLRLINIQMLRTGGADAPYVVISGQYAMIRNIFLYDGNQLLDEVRGLNILSGVLGINHTNGDLLSLNNRKLGTGIGYTLLEPDALLTDSTDVYQCTDNVHSQSGYIDLRLVFDFLRQVPYLNGQVFRNLKVVIEWADPLKSTSADGVTGATIQQPILSVDQLIDEQDMVKANEMMKAGEVLPYSTWQNEVFQAKAVAGNATGVEDQFSSYAFTGKTIDKLIMINSLPTLDANTANNVCKLGHSLAVRNENIQILVNKSELFNYGGVDNPQLKTKMLVDALGECNIPWGTNLPNVAGADFLSKTLNFSFVTADQLPALLVGKLDYKCFKIDRKIDSLAVNIKKNGTPNLNTPAYNIHLYANVMKAITFLGGNSYRVVYL